MQQKVKTEKDGRRVMKYKVITYFDNMEDEVEIFDNKDEAINRVHHLRGVKYRNSKMYTVEMEEVHESTPIGKR